MTSVYDFTAKTIDGREQKLSDYKVVREERLSG